jgi:hypothetical protein
MAESGYLGLGPQVISKECPDVWDGEQGVTPEMGIDGALGPYEVWLFLGAKTPFVLQPNEGLYLLLGECYLHGFMDGLALPDKQESHRIQAILM